MRVLAALASVLLAASVADAAVFVPMAPLPVGPSQAEIGAHIQRAQEFTWTKISGRLKSWDEYVEREGGRQTRILALAAKALDGDECAVRVARIVEISAEPGEWVNVPEIGRIPAGDGLCPLALRSADIMRRMSLDSGLSKGLQKRLRTALEALDKRILEILGASGHHLDDGK